MAVEKTTEDDVAGDSSGGRAACSRQLGAEEVEVEAVVDSKDTPGSV